MARLSAKQVSTLTGSCLLHLMIGSGGTFANLNTYMTSYLRQNSSRDANYGQSVWFTAVSVTTFTTITIISGCIGNKLGTRVTCFIATLIFCAAIAVTAVTIKSSLLMVLLSFSFAQNVGNGLIYSTVIVNAIKWFPRHKGLVSGLITGSNAFSSFIFIQMQTFYLNPNNITPNSDGYFDETELLSKVPKLFTLLSLVYGFIGFLGVCLIFNSDDNYSERQSNQTIDVINVNDSCDNDVYSSTTTTTNNGDNENLMNQSIESNEVNYSLRYAIKTPLFTILLITFALSTQTTYLMNSMIKAFGQSYISDDHYLSVIVSLSFIINGMGGLFWGKVMDHLKFRDTLITINAILAVTTFTLKITGYYYQKIMFAIWDFSLFFTTVGVFSCFLPEVVRKFGHQNSITIYGLIHTGPAILNVIMSPLLEWSLNRIGWFADFCIVASLNAISMIVIMVSYSRIK
ncbi:uncharacterized protein LOC128963960 [Oppia nitens]|uniref:uncharacterized protein LOC128963960 n=1 Tax=Oppia nitens TaxID=1686743 RepID=UPI0023D9AD51|nr:uncharacterized protein LOC128963960 [Oppia nitens]